MSERPASASSSVFSFFCIDLFYLWGGGGGNNTLRQVIGLAWSAIIAGGIPDQSLIRIFDRYLISMRSRRTPAAGAGPREGWGVGNRFLIPAIFIIIIFFCFETRYIEQGWQLGTRTDDKNLFFNFVSKQFGRHLWSLMELFVCLFFFWRSSRCLQCFPIRAFVIAFVIRIYFFNQSGLDRVLMGSSPAGIVWEAPRPTWTNVEVSRYSTTIRYWNCNRIDIKSERAERPIRSSIRIRWRHSIRIKAASSSRVAPLASASAFRPLHFVPFLFLSFFLSLRFRELVSLTFFGFVCFDRRWTRPLPAAQQLRARRQQVSRSLVLSLVRSIVQSAASLSPPPWPVGLNWSNPAFCLEAIP